MRDSLLKIESDLNFRYFEREDFIHGLILATLSGQHIFVLGPPGAGKTEIIQEYASCLDGSVFDILMMRTTTPDELFGPPDIPALQSGQFRRVIDGMAPMADVLCLDEIWKGGSATLNGLLRMLAQREFTQSGESIPCPLLFAVGASNELPQEESLRALYSRFQLRYTVGPIESKDALQRLLWSPRAPIPDARIPVADVPAVRDEIRNIGWSESAKQSVVAIIDGLAECKMTPDVRKLVALVGSNASIVQCEAYINGHDAIQPTDLMVLQHALWDHPKQIDTVMTIVSANAAPAIDRLILEANQCFEEWKILDNDADNPNRLNSVMNILKRVGTIVRESAIIGETLPGPIRTKLETIKNQSATLAIKLRKGK